MSIAFDQFNAGSSGSSTFSYVVTVGADNPILFVQVDAASAGAISSVTANGTAMAALFTDLAWVAGQKASLYYIVGKSGSVTVTVNISGSVSVGSQASSWTGVKTLGATPASVSNNVAGTTTITKAITATRTNNWIVGFSEGSTSGTLGLTAGTGTTRFSAANANFVFDSANVTAGSNSFTIGTLGSSGSLFVFLVEIAFAEINVSDSTNAVTDSLAIAQAIAVAVSDTSISSDSQRIKNGMNNQAKNSTSWTNQAKS